MHELKLVDGTAAGDRVGRYGDLVIVSYVSPSVDAPMARFLSAQPPTGPYALLTIYAPDVAPPGRANRDRIIALQAQLAHLLRASAMVILGEGFLAASHRSAVSRLRLMSKATYPRDVFCDIGHAAVWLATTLSGYEARGIERAVRQLQQLPVSGG